MFSHPELGSDPPIGSDRESGCDTVPKNMFPRQRELMLSSGITLNGLLST